MTEGLAARKSAAGDGPVVTVAMSRSGQTRSGVEWFELTLSYPGSSAYREVIGALDGRLSVRYTLRGNV